MKYEVKERNTYLQKIIEEDLKPIIKKIDGEAFYAKDFLLKLAKGKFFSSENKSLSNLLREEMQIVEEVAKNCLTTAFCLWCHLAGLTYVRNTNNLQLKNKLLPALENGEFLGGTALSNPMKYFAGLENSLHLNAKLVENGYVISGVLPAVSNLSKDHWFGIVTHVNENEQIICIVPCHVDGLSLKERTEFLGVNGSATYTCTFKDVFVPKEWVLSENAISFVEQIRPAFIAYQIPLGLGVIEASIDSIEKVSQRQNRSNRFLKKQAEDLRQEVNRIREKINQVISEENWNWKDMAKIRLETAYLTLEAVQTNMIHQGSPGYLTDSAHARRLREAYFYANLTPTIRHLEKVLSS